MLFTFIYIYMLFKTVPELFKTARARRGEGRFQAMPN